MPYAPTNLYPRNVTLEESDELLFLGDVDKNDIIEDAQVELINGEGDTEYVICPKSQKMYSKKKSDKTEYWDSKTFRSEHSGFPLQGYKNNTLKIKTEPILNSSNQEDAFLELSTSNKIQIYYSYESYGGLSYYHVDIPCIYPYTTTTVNDKETTTTIEYENVTVHLTFVREHRSKYAENPLDYFTGRSSWSWGISTLQLKWQLFDVQITDNANKSNLEVKAFDKNYLTQTLSSYHTEPMGDIPRDSTKFPGSTYSRGQGETYLIFMDSKIDCPLTLVTLSNGEKSFYLYISLSYEWNYEKPGPWDTIENWEEVPGFINKLKKTSKTTYGIDYGAQEYDGSGDEKNQHSFTDDECYCVITESQKTSLSELKKNFSWRYFLTGREFDNLVFEGPCEVVTKEHPVLNMNYDSGESRYYTNLTSFSQLGPIYFTNPDNSVSEYKYWCKSNTNKIYLIKDPSQIAVNDIVLTVENLDNIVSFQKGAPISEDTLLGYSKKNSAPYIRKRKVASIQGNGSQVTDYDYSSANWASSKNSSKYNVQYVKIPALLNCPNYFYDSGLDMYFIKSDKYSSFLIQEVCRVEQTYNTSNYSYIIKLPYKLKEYIGSNVDIKEDVKCYLGTNDITDEIKSSLNNNTLTLTFSSEIPYLVAEKTITQNIFCSFERDVDYLRPILKEHISYFFKDDARTSDWGLYTSRIIDDNFNSRMNTNLTSNTILKLYTNEIYSLENKYNQVKAFDFEIQLDYQKPYLHITSDEIDRLQSFQILLYLKNGELIYQSEECFGKQIEYIYRHLKPNTEYRLEIRIKTIEGLIKFNYKDFKTSNFNIFYRDYLIDTSSYSINIPLRESIPDILKNFYTDLNTNFVSLWKNNLNLVFNKQYSKSKIIDYKLNKNEKMSYTFLLKKMVIINKGENNQYPTVSWEQDNIKYQLTMENDNFILLKNTENENTTTEKYELFNIENSYLIFKNDDKTIYLDVVKTKFSLDIGQTWINLESYELTFVNNVNQEVIEIDLGSFKTQDILPSEWITPAVFGIKPNPEENDENIYEIDPEQIWYFNLDTKAENIDFTTTHNIQQTLSQYPRVGLSNTNFMSQSITTKLGYLNEDDMYVGDNGEKLTKFAKFANDGNVKILRLPNGYLIPVDIQLNSNVSQYNLVGEPSDITFKWTQVADHETCVLYGWE